MTRERPAPAGREATLVRETGASVVPLKR